MIVLPKTSGQGIQVEPAAPTFPWRDLEGTEWPDPAGADAPQFSTFRTNIRAYSFAANDKIDIRFHVPHDYVPGSNLYIHHHWSHNGTAISGNLVIDTHVTYAKGHNQAAFPATKNQTMTYNTTNIATTPQYQHRIDEVQLSSNGGSATLLDSSTIEVDGLILVGLVVTTIPTITGGSPNEPFIFRCDIHYQSNNIGTKQRSPPFWT